MTKAHKGTFEPTKQQIRFIKRYLNLDDTSTIVQISEETGVPRRTIYNWFDKKEFRDYINSKKNELLEKSLADRYKVAIRKAKAGDFSFSKLLFEMQGEYIQKSESQVTHKYDDYKDKSDEEIIKELEHELNNFKATKTDRQNNKSQEA